MKYELGKNDSTGVKLNSFNLREVVNEKKEKYNVSDHCPQTLKECTSNNQDQKMPFANEPSASMAGGFPACRQAGGGWHSPNLRTIAESKYNNK